jgi:adenylate kinase
MKRNLVLFGPPAAGKGTFSSQIIKILPNIIHISSGDVFRDYLKEDHPIGTQVKNYIEEGMLIPDEIVIQEIKEELEKEDINKYGFIMDGFPRTLAQAKFLDKYEVNLCLLLDVDENIIEKRVLGRYSCQKCNAIYNKYFLKPKTEGICDKCGAKIEFVQRTDDNVETFQKRLELYKNYSKPIIEYYNAKGILKKVESEDTLKLSTEEIKRIIGL